MKKVLVLIVLCVLSVGVMPASVEADISPDQSDFTEKLAALLLNSPFEVQVGNIQRIDADSGRISLNYCVYSRVNIYSTCLTFLVTDHTNIRVDGQSGLGSRDDLELGQNVVVEFVTRAGEAYARQILASNNYLFFEGSIRDIDPAYRTIRCCMASGRICTYPLFVPEYAIITFDWNQELHDFDDLHLRDGVRTLYTKLEDQSGYAAPIIHVLESGDSE